MGLAPWPPETGRGSTDTQRILAQARQHRRFWLLRREREEDRRGFQARVRPVALTILDPVWPLPVALAPPPPHDTQ